MWKSVKSTAEEHFASMQKKKAKKAVTDQEKAIQDRAKLTARLRALRLAKEATDTEAAEAAAAEKATAKDKKRSQLT